MTENNEMFILRLFTLLPYTNQNKSSVFFVYYTKQFKLGSNKLYIEPSKLILVLHVYTFNDYGDGHYCIKRRIRYQCQPYQSVLET